MDTKPLWIEEENQVSYPPLVEDIHVDVLIIGGGITGITAAYEIRRAGLKVALVERYQLTGGDTSHTTAHLTYMTDTRLSELIHTAGKDNARLVWQAGKQGMDYISQTIANLGIDADLVDVPGYLVTAELSDIDEERKRLQEEAEAASEMGFEVEYLDSVPPTNRPGIRFAEQKKFHPLKYLQALAAESARQGAMIYENTDVTAFEESPRHVIANGHKIAFENVVIATHVPLQGNRRTIGAALFQTKIASYSTYAIAALIPSGRLPEMIWSDTGDPFNYLRIERTDHGDIAILGGEDHKTGQIVQTVDCYANLENTLANLVGDFDVTHRWSGQVVETIDGLPFIGESNAGQFVATGFSGNGMTLGTAAALMARDKITGKENPYEKAFDPHRKKLGGLSTYLAENKDFPYRLITDRLAIHQGNSEDLAPGKGKVIKSDGKSVAACRDSNGTLHRISAICPHMGCIVAWNESEETWDCPCHGSRFTADGKVIAGPAEQSLEPIQS